MIRTVCRLFFVFLLGQLALIANAQTPKWKSLEAEGDTLYSRQEYEPASKIYSKVLESNVQKDGKYEDKNLYGILYKRAVCYYSMEEYDNALKDLDMFEPVFPKAPQPKLLKAFIYRALDNIDKQLEYLQQAMALQPPNADFLKWRGMLLIQKDKYGEALADLLEARQFQDDPEVETYLGVSYYHTENVDSAFISFNKAIELDPTYAASYLYAGTTALQEESYALSIEYLNLALRLDAKNKEALYYKGVALVESKQIEEGCRCLNRAFYAGLDDAGDYLTQYCFDVDN